MPEKINNLFDHRLQNLQLENALKSSIKQIFPIENAGKTISTVMRQATWDYLKLQEAIKKNGYKKYGRN